MASRLSTAVVPAATANTIASSRRGRPREPCAIAAPSASNSPASRQPSARTSSAARNAIVGPRSETADRASSALSTPVATRRPPATAATAQSGASRGRATAAARVAASATSAATSLTVHRPLRTRGHHARPAERRRARRSAAAQRDPAASGSGPTCGARSRIARRTRSGRYQFQRAEQLHRRRHEDRADDRRVEQDRRREPEAELLQPDEAARDEPGERRDHDDRRGRDDASRVLEAVRDRRLVVVAAVPLLADPREQEHLVVHRQPEEEREQEDRDPRVDLGRLAQPEARSPAVLEREHEHAVRRADREQVHQDGLRRQHDGAERAQQDQVRDHEHREDEPRERAVGLVDEVDAERGRAAHEHLGPGREPGCGHVALAQARARGPSPAASPSPCGRRPGSAGRGRRRRRGWPGGRAPGARTPAPAIVCASIAGIAAQLGDEAALGGDDRGRAAPPGGAVSTTIWCGASAPAPSVVSRTCSPLRGLASSAARRGCRRR